MIKVHLSDTQSRWIMPHRIVHVNGSDQFNRMPIEYFRNCGTWATGDGFSTMPGAQIKYMAEHPNVSDYFYVKETPEQIAAMVKVAMPLVQL